MTPGELTRLVQEGETIRGTALGGAALARADLSGGIFEDVDFTAADLTATKWRESILVACRFDQARLPRADFSKANLARCTLRGADLAEARFQRSLVAECDFTGAGLARADPPVAFVRGCG